jgi:4'-phosphopantetheinyl transferase
MRPKLTPPAPGEVHAWRVELPSEERRGAARGALAKILAAYLGGAAEVTRDDAGNAKPRLAAAPERLSFNLSHSGRLALVAIAPGGVEVGIDVERLRPRRDLIRLAERWLPTDDAATIAATTDGAPREAAFYAAWTRHEARVKCTGEGLAGAAPGPAVVAWQLEIDTGYAAAVALDLEATGVAEPLVTVRAWDVRGGS